MVERRVDKNLRHKLSTFQEETRCKNALHLTLITTYGLKFNEYAGRIQKVSGCFRTDGGADDFAKLHSIAETAMKNGNSKFNAILAVVQQ